MVTVSPWWWGQVTRPLCPNSLLFFLFPDDSDYEDSAWEEELTGAAGDMGDKVGDMGDKAGNTAGRGGAMGATQCPQGPDAALDLELGNTGGGWRGGFVPTVSPLCPHRSPVGPPTEFGGGLSPRHPNKSISAPNQLSTLF